MLNNSEQEMKIACLLHCGDELSQARFLKECTPEKILSYIDWSDDEIDSLQKDCNDKDDRIANLEDVVADLQRELEASENKLSTLKADITILYNKY